MTTHEGRRKAGKAGWLVVGFGVAVICLLWAGIAWDLRKERARVVEAAQADTANLARAFEEHIQRTVAGLDQTLVYLKAEYERAPERFSINKSIANNVILGKVAVQVARIGADGVLADSNVAGFTRFDLSDRNHFRVHRDPKAVQPFISRPVLGRASGRWSIQLTRRLERNGAFDGVVVISLDPHYLSDFYSSIDIGAQGSVLLVGHDGIVRAASETGAPQIGESIGDSRLIDRVFSAGGGSEVLDGPLDGIRRITSFRALSKLPLAVMVGRSEHEVMAAHRGTEIAYCLVGVALTVVLGGAVALLFQMVRRQEIIARDLTVKKAELVESRERLKRYVADLERIAEVSAHDLQEPLRRVVAYAQLLAKHAEDVLDEEGRGYVAQVVQGAQRIRKLVQDLESFVAVDHLPPADHVVSAEEAASVAVERLAEDIGLTSATVIVDALPEVAAEPRSLAEIFTQLLDNGLRYRAEDRRPIIHLSGRTEDGVAVFVVRDNGIGIERRHFSRIFEIFHRLHGVDERPGTGMGLAIARRMIERMGGRIWVESEVGVGTTFTFTLPLQAQALADPEADAA
ncbi:MAG: sensor histidine kinase [Solirubrobacterales bacterium]